MTREEAITNIEYLEWAFDLTDEHHKALDMAIEALSVANLKEEFESAECEDYEHATLVDIKEPLKVSVVRCKDCKWAEKAIFDEYCVECTMHHTTFMKHGFCNHGERREPTE